MHKICLLLSYILPLILIKNTIYSKMGGLPPFSCFCDGGLAVLFENQGHQRNEIRKQSCGILICTVPKTAARTKTRMQV